MSVSSLVCYGAKINKGAISIPKKSCVLAAKNHVSSVWNPKFRELLDYVVVVFLRHTYKFVVFLTFHIQDTSEHKRMVLPPGYEDVTLCPPGYCKLINPAHQHMVGSAAGLYVCQRNTDAQSKHIPVSPWGSKTDSLQKLIDLINAGYSCTPCALLDSRKKQEPAT